jgi:hypothetical protein
VRATAVEVAAHDGLVNIDITIPDFQVEAAVRVGADPGFVVNGCPLTAKVGKGYQVSGVTLKALGETVFHEIPPPSQIKSFTVYTR